MSNGRSWHTLKEFMIHVAIGAIAFFFISLIAVSLSMWVAYLENNGINAIIVKGLEAFEYMLFGIDILLASIFLQRSMYKLVKELW